MPPNHDDIIATLRDLAPELQERFGVSALSDFGSCGRGQLNPASDVDVLVAFRPDAVVTLLILAAMTRLLEDHLRCRVDVVEDHPRLMPSLRRAIQRDLLRVA